MVLHLLYTPTVEQWTRKGRNKNEGRDILSYYGAVYSATPPGRKALHWG